MGKMLSTATNYMEWQCKYHVLVIYGNIPFGLLKLQNFRKMCNLSDITEHIPVCVDVMLILS